MIVSAELNKNILPQISEGLSRINAEGKIEVLPPDDAGKNCIKTTITVTVTAIFLRYGRKGFR